MTSTNGSQLRDRLGSLAVAVSEDRSRTDGVDRARRSVASRQSTLDEIGRRYDEFRQEYLDLVALAADNLDRVGSLGDGALLINVPVSRDNQLVYDDMMVRTVARRRAETLAALVDTLLGKLGDVGSKPERILGPALLSLLRPELRDLRADVDMNLDENWAQGFEQYLAAGYAPMHAAMTGPEVRLIGADLSWDVARLVNLQP